MAIDLKRLIRRVPEELYGQGKLDLIDELFAENYVGHEAIMGETDREGLAKAVQGYRRAFPDLRMEVLDTIREGDRVAVRWRSTGTHQGELFGRPATHKRATVEGLSMATFRDGKITESWVQMNGLRMLQQLGIVPPLRKADGNGRAHAQPRH